MGLYRFKSQEGKHVLYDSYQKLLAGWDVAVEEADIPTTWGETHVITAGSRHRPPLMLFHGVADNSALMWIFNAAELSRHFFVIAVDTLGGPGKSEPNAGYAKGFEQAPWIHELVNWFGFKRLYVAGVSNGAYLASCYTIAYPEYVEKMIGMAGGIKPSMLRMARLFLPEALLPASGTTTRKLLRKLTAPGSTVFESHPEIMRHWTYLLRYFNNRSMMVHTYKKFLDPEIALLREKGIFYIGEHDRLSYYPAAIRTLDHHQVPYVIIPGAGHGLNHEQAERMNREIIGFLQGEL
ncbi:hypothetical protein GCM10010912_48040 [Paenibacillus albidus]|uniref:AB hydrolase-1 domain-containing protein n=1 Tax=Paenibacillus albidus TaxID=2041023 RepID=A0A917CU51_9BACL|nr:alpha/beta hydrolase [Paenibacillus albidus]GGF97721.1 hypothetical protein GCM10010912_48040 [Paenibacillus albidus]